MSMGMSEEFKEALLRVKGGGVFVMVIKEGILDVLPDCFDIVEEVGRRVVLQARRPEIPDEDKQRLVAEIIQKVEPELKATIAEAVKDALLEKPLGELMMLAGAKEAKIKRKRGCLWIITDKTEHVL